jgi:hypothetical protein
MHSVFQRIFEVFASGASKSGWRRGSGVSGVNILRPKIGGKSLGEGGFY